MERIDPIRRDDAPWVAPAAPTRRVDRRQEGDQGERRRQRQGRPSPEPSSEPEGRPDAEGHIDVSA